MKRIIGIIMTIMLISVNVISSYASSIDLGINKTPKLDIMLAIDNRAVDGINVDSIENDIDNELIGGGQDTKDTTYVSKESSETKSTDLNFADVVNSWTKIGSHCWESSGPDIYCVVGGDPTTNGHYEKTNINERWSESLGFKAWWGSGLIDPKAYDTNKFNMKFQLVDNGTMHNGILFNISRNEDGSLNGYMFNLTMHNKFSDSCLWRLTNYQLDMAFTAGINHLIWCNADRGPSSNKTKYWTKGNIAQADGMEAKCIWNWPFVAGNNLNYEVNYENGHLKIVVNGTNTLIDQDLKDLDSVYYTSGTYGFYGINCEQVASMKIANFTISKEETKNFSDILLNNKWRDNSIRNVTNIQNKIDNTLLDNAVITNTLNNDIHFIQWGSVENKGVIDKFLNAIEQNGTNFYYKKEDITGD